jgi:dihydrofolate reductase
MVRLIYSAIASLDGYVEDSDGQFDWAAPDDDVLSFLNEVERPVGTYLYGRRMYETMRYWETAPSDGDVPEPVRDFAAIWRRAEKIVYSRTLNGVTTAGTRLERSLRAEEIHHLKQTASHDLTIGGANLAGQAIESGLVDELHLYVVPAVAGGGKPWLPARLRLSLELLGSRTFASGFVFLRYRAASGGPSSP